MITVLRHCVRCQKQMPLLPVKNVRGRTLTGPYQQLLLTQVGELSLAEGEAQAAAVVLAGPAVLAATD